MMAVVEVIVLKRMATPVTILLLPSFEHGEREAILAATNRAFSSFYRRWAKWLRIALSRLNMTHLDGVAISGELMMINQLDQ